MNLLREWRAGGGAAVREIAAALPHVASLIEREASAARRAPQLVSTASLEYFQDFHK